LADLKSAQADECAHRDEAKGLYVEGNNFVLKVWCKLVSFGSVSAVKLARLV